MGELPCLRALGLQSGYLEERDQPARRRKRSSTPPSPEVILLEVILLEVILLEVILLEVILDYSKPGQQAGTAGRWRTWRAQPAWRRGGRRSARPTRPARGRHCQPPCPRRQISARAWRPVPSQGWSATRTAACCCCWLLGCSAVCAVPASESENLRIAPIAAIDTDLSGQIETFAVRRTWGTKRSRAVRRRARAESSA